jgi:short-subunit dehydrogenase
MALAESMHGDLRHTNVTVQLANPGYIQTRMQDDNPHSKPFIMSPEKAAQEVFDQMNTETFHKAFPFGFSLLFRFSRFLCRRGSMNGSSSAVSLTSIKDARWHWAHTA